MAESQQQEEQQQPPPPAVSVTPLTPEQERMWAMLCHLLALAGFIIPLGHILGPLIIWLIQREKSAFVDQNGKESLNFQISVTIYGFVAFILCFIVIGFLLLPALGLFAIIMVILAAVKTNKGETWRYPLCIRFLK